MPTPAAQTWKTFCQTLANAAQVLAHPNTPQTPLHQAEGLRYLTRLLRAALESQVESADPCHPRFFQLANETIKIGNDNPDNLYHNANISGACTYRIRGTRGTVPYLSFCSTGGGYERDGLMAPTGQLDHGDLHCDEDGAFEVIASAQKQARNWLPLASNSTGIVVRQTFQHRAEESPARYTIKCMTPRRSDALRAEDMEPALLRAAAFVNQTAALFAGWMNDFAAHENQLPANDQARCQRAGGDANIHYHNSRFRLAPEEALLVEFTPPECETWNLQLSNFWMESLDYRYHRIHVNKFTAHYEADGGVRIVIAARAPNTAKFPNWLDTCAHDEGAMLLRYVGARTFPPVTTRVLPLAELA